MRARTKSKAANFAARILRTRLSHESSHKRRRVGTLVRETLDRCVAYEEVADVLPPSVQHNCMGRESDRIRGSTARSIDVVPASSRLFSWVYLTRRACSPHIGYPPASRCSSRLRMAVYVSTEKVAHSKSGCSGITKARGPTFRSSSRTSASGTAFMIMASRQITSGFSFASNSCCRNPRAGLRLAVGGA